MNKLFNNLLGFIWVNGEFIKWSKAKIHLINHAMHYGSSVFESNRIYNNKIFKLKEHTNRLFKSAKLLDMKIPYTKNEINKACINTLKKQGFKNAYMRPIVWRGSEQMGINAQNTKINIAIAAWKILNIFSINNKLKGITLTIAKYRRPSPKTAPYKAKAAGLYVICTISKHEAKIKGFSDALMLDYNGFIAEATSANIFFVKNGELHTPDPYCFLNGITRCTIIELAKKNNINVFERRIKLKELNSFDECFLTSTTDEIIFVKQINNFKFTTSVITEQLLRLYINLTTQLT